jgi:prepilin-type N-terminal cleavage/methylation domain-containing protein
VTVVPRSAALNHARAGHTLLELLVVLGLMGMFTAWALHARPSRVALAAVALRTQLLQARYAAIERNEPVAVVYRDGEQAFLTLASGELDVAAACESGEEIARLRLSEFPRVRVTKVPANGVVWLPSGTGRTCTGGGAFNQTIALADPVREARVIVSRAGRVRSEVGR